MATDSVRLDPLTMTPSVDTYERLAVERESIENVSIGRDLRILALTLPSVLGRRGAY